MNPVLIFLIGWIFGAIGMLIELKITGEIKDDEGYEQD